MGDGAQEVINWLLTAAGALFGVVMKLFRDDVKDLQTRATAIEAKHNAHEVHVARGYVTREELRESVDAVNDKLDAIFNKLDGKEDKRRT